MRGPKVILGTPPSAFINYLGAKGGSENKKFSPPPLPLPLSPTTGGKINMARKGAWFLLVATTMIDSDFKKVFVYRSSCLAQQRTGPP